MNGLRLDGIRKAFGDVLALESIELELAEGELVSLLGPSGCGKTTALRIVAGFERPDVGAVTVGGRDVTALPPNRRDMGMVFQAYSLFPNMTAEQNVEYGLRIRNRSKEDRVRRVAALLELVGLEHAAARYPHQLSGGMQQRVALARALAIEPRVLLLDEPLSALDALVRVQLREEIRRIQTELAITTLYVTHDQEEALSVSDRVVVMSHGRIEQAGTPAEIYSAPRSRFVAEFIGTMNRLDATVAGDGEVEYRGKLLAVEAARGLPGGETVLVLVRPEAIDVQSLTNGSPPPGGLVGAVVAHTFLGSVTRLKIDVGAPALVAADVSSSRAAATPVGAQVVARFAPAEARVLAAARLPS